MVKKSHNTSRRPFKTNFATLIVILIISISGGIASCIKSDKVPLENTAPDLAQSSFASKHKSDKEKHKRSTTIQQKRTKQSAPIALTDDEDDGIIVITETVPESTLKTDRTETLGNKVTLAPHERFDARVIRVVDGDTIIVSLDGKQTRIRMIGIDTPESVHPNPEKNTVMGHIASQYTMQALDDQWVTIELDERIYDRYDRLLAYIFLNDQNYNLELVESGLAWAKSYPPNRKYDALFKAAEERAKHNHLGIWSR